MEAPDLSALSQAFLEFGGQIFRKRVNAWMMDPMIGRRINVKKPQALTKLSAVGGPRPYAAANDLTDGAKFTDRILTVEQSNWDYDVDPEKFRNTYLAQNTDVPFFEFIIDQVAKEYLSQLNNRSVYFGVDKSAISAWQGGPTTYVAGDEVSFVEGELTNYYRANATTLANESPATHPAKWDKINVEAIAEGWKSLLEKEIAAANIIEVATGAITAANAVTKIEQMVESTPAWYKEEDGIIFASWTNFENYKKHYRTLNGFKFEPRANGEYFVDGYRNIRLRPVSWLGSSGRVIATLREGLVYGTDGESVELHTSMRRNIIEVRQMMPVGFQMSDVEVVFPNDQP